MRQDARRTDVVAVLPPVVMLDRRRLPPMAALLYAGALALLAMSFGALVAHVERSDLGQGGTGLDVVGWLAAATAAAAAAVVVTVRSARGTVATIRSGGGCRA